MKTNTAGDVSKLKLQLLWVQRAWKAGRHNAFTDLCYFRQRYYLVFRQASSHHSKDGFLRVMSSVQGKKWRTVAVLHHPAADLRDGKLVVTPEGTLQLLAAAAFHDDEVARLAELVTRVVNPVLMLVMGVLIGGIVVLMYLPIFQVAEQIQ